MGIIIPSVTLRKLKEVTLPSPRYYSFLWKSQDLNPDILSQKPNLLTATLQQGMRKIEIIRSKLLNMRFVQLWNNGTSIC